jgi:hypothetical protein
MKCVKILMCIILCAIMVFPLSKSSFMLESLYVTKCLSGATVTVVCDYLNTFVIDSAYSVERDEKDVVIRTKSGPMIFSRNSVISLNWDDRNCN